jgi:hypothetical protein
MYLSSGKVRKYNGTPQQWEDIYNDGPVASLVSTADSLIMLKSDGDVNKFSEKDGSWPSIGFDRDIISIVSAGKYLFLLRSDGGW